MQSFPEYESFRHGLIVSKIWLCEELENAFSTLQLRKPTVHILAGWDNLLTFMLITRKPKFYNKFYNYDLNKDHIDAANKLCETWRIEEPKVVNIVADVNQHKNYEDSVQHVVVNCSVDQIEGSDWYNNIPNTSLICLQTTNLEITGHPWYIKTVTKSISEFENKFKMQKIIFSGEKNIDYGNWGYTRFMIIGIK